eukprot:1177202-Amphidinium_carterae.1
MRSSTAPRILVTHYFTTLFKPEVKCEASPLVVRPKKNASVELLLCEEGLTDASVVAEVQKSGREHHVFCDTVAEVAVHLASIKDNTLASPVLDLATWTGIMCAYGCFGQGGLAHRVLYGAALCLMATEQVH